MIFKYSHLILIIFKQLYTFQYLFLFENNNGHLLEKLYGFKYSYLILTIFKQIHSTKRKVPNKY